MTIAERQRVLQISQKVELLAAAVASIGTRLNALEEAFSILGRAQVTQVGIPTELFERINKLDGEIRAMKARMGKIREPVE